MRIRDLLAAESIELNGSAAGKQDVLNKMVDLMAKSGKIRDVETYRKGVFAREEEGTTGIGEGIAIPHCKSDAVKAPGLAAMVVKDGVEFDALDGAPVNLLFLIAAPNTEDNVHLEVLSKLSVLLMDENFTNGLKNAKTVDEFLKVIDDAESAKDEDEKEDETGAKYKVLAVTGCPTGIAHTYMAAESLEKHAAEMGIFLYHGFLDLRGGISFADADSIRSPESFGKVILGKHFHGFLPDDRLCLGFEFASQQINTAALFRQKLCMADGICHKHRLCLLNKRDHRLGGCSGIQINKIIRADEGCCILCNCILLFRIHRLTVSDILIMCTHTRPSGDCTAMHLGQKTILIHCD